MTLPRPRLIALLVAVLASSSDCRSKEAATPAPAATPQPTVIAEATAAATEPTIVSPAPTPTATPQPLAELVVPTAVDLSQTPTPTPASVLSPAEERLEQDAKKLAAALDPIVADADALDEQFTQYVATCFQKYTTQKWQPPTGLGAADQRHWVTILDPEPTVFFRHNWREQPVAVVVWPVERCEELWDDMKEMAPTIFERVDALAEPARRAGVLPGNLRALLKKHRLVR
jgi:hypothetical protein